MLRKYLGLASILSLAAADSSLNAKHLHVKFALWDGYYYIPLTVSAATAKGEYVFMANDTDLNAMLYCYPGDPRVAIIYDSYGNIAGLRTSYIKDDVGRRAASNNLPFPYDYDAQPMFTSGNYLNTSLWYTSVLFISPELLKAGGRKSTGGVVAQDVYVRLNGQWTLLPVNECDAEAAGFTQQACFTGMGNHYFYQITPDMSCANMQGVFLLYDSGSLIGLGVIPWGSFTSKNRVWFEDPSADVVKDIVPSRPACLTNWVTNYGTSSLHIFFKMFPRLTFCWPWDKATKCSKTKTVQ